MKLLPCDVGLCCPYCHSDKDGMEFCSFPDLEPVANKLYPLTCGFEKDDCVMMPAPNSPLGKFIESCDKLKNFYPDYWKIEVNVGVKGND